MGIHVSFPEVDYIIRVIAVWRGIIFLSSQLTRQFITLVHNLHDRIAYRITWYYFIFQTFDLYLQYFLSFLISIIIFFLLNLCNNFVKVYNVLEHTLLYVYRYLIYVIQSVTNSAICYEVPYSWCHKQIPFFRVRI